MNKIIIIGNLGKNPEMRYTPTGVPVTTFSVASTFKRTSDSGEKVEETTWFNVSAFNTLAEAANTYLSKGSKVYVEGRLKLRTYDRRDGTPGASLDVAASHIEFLSARAASPEMEPPEA